MYKSDTYSDFRESGGPIVWTRDIVKMVVKHSRLIDRLNPDKMADMVFWCFDILNGSAEKPKKKNWKFVFGKDWMDIK